MLLVQEFLNRKAHEGRKENQFNLRDLPDAARHRSCREHTGARRQGRRCGLCGEFSYWFPTHPR